MNTGHFQTIQRLLFPSEVFCFNAQTCVLPMALLREQGICHLSKQPPCTWSHTHTHVTRSELTTQAESGNTGVCAANSLGHGEPPVRWGQPPERQQIAAYQETESCTLAFRARLKQGIQVQNQRKAVGRGCRIIDILLSCSP